jgi:hypothetical protein
MTYERIKVLDYRAFGLKVKEWTNNEASRPRTLADFKAQTATILELPARITEDPVYPYPQWSISNLVIRLPAPELLKQTEDEVGINPGRYPAPGFYDDIVAGTLVGKDALYCRVGDYTIAQCQ